MRKLILISILMFPLICNAQIPSLNLFPINKDTGKSEFTEVVECKQSMNTLFRNAKTWIATANVFNDGERRLYKPIISMEDVSTGRIVVDCTYKHYSPARYRDSDMTINASFKITIDCKDNKYRYKIYDYVDYTKYGDKEYIDTFETYNNDFKNGSKKEFVLSQNKFFTNIINSLKGSMNVDDDF